MAAPKPYHQTSASLASVSLNFTSAAIGINGVPNWGHWTYNIVSSDCTHSMHLANYAYQTLDDVQWQYNASTLWLTGDAQLFWQSGLDPNEQHQIELINAAGAGIIMTFNDFTVYVPNVTTTIPLSSFTFINSFISLCHRRLRVLRQAVLKAALKALQRLQ